MLRWCITMIRLSKYFSGTCTNTRFSCSIDKLCRKFCAERLCTREEFQNKKKNKTKISVQGSQPQRTHEYLYYIISTVCDIRVSSFCLVRPLPCLDSARNSRLLFGIHVNIEIFSYLRNLPFAYLGERYLYTVYYCYYTPGCSTR